MTETRPHDEAAIKDVLASLYKAWDAGDADGFVADYTAGRHRDHARQLPRQSGRRSARAWPRASRPLKGSTTIDKLAEHPLPGRGRRDRGERVRHPFPGETEVPARAQGERDLGAGEARRRLADRGVPQQPGRAAGLTPGPAGFGRSVVDQDAELR